MGASSNSPAEDLQFIVRRDLKDPSQLGLHQVVVKNGPRAYKVAVLRSFDDPATGELKHREFRVQAYRRKKSGTGYDFDKTEATWYCEDAEIARVQALLNEQLPTTGVYRKVTDATSQLLSQLDQLDKKSTVVLIEAMTRAPGIADALSQADGARLLIDAVALHGQRRALGSIERVAEDPASSEPDIQRELEGNWWLFGGKFISKANRRSLTVLDQLDIPLIRADGSLYVVELKKANIPGLIVEHRNHWVVGRDVHEAVSQGMNYLRALDEQRASILADLEVEARRSSALVVIGHPKFAEAGTGEQINETLRTYNSHLARIEVVTYQDLLGGARRALKMGEEAEAAGEPT
jgi:hypothetical protein